MRCQKRSSYFQHLLFQNKMWFPNVYHVGFHSTTRGSIIVQPCHTCHAKKERWFWISPTDLFSSPWSKKKRFSALLYILYHFFILRILYWIKQYPQLGIYISLIFFFSWKRIEIFRRYSFLVTPERLTFHSLDLNSVSAYCHHMILVVLSVWRLCCWIN